MARDERRGSEADIDAFRAGWEATTIERQTGRLGDIEACLRTVAARAGAWPTDAQIAEALEQRAAMYRTWFVPRPGAEEVLAHLRADGYPLALVSMCTPDTPMWRSSPLAGTVDVEIFSSEVALRKPDPEIYLLAERLDVRPMACLYVGDGSRASGAAAVGMRPLLIRDLQKRRDAPTRGRRLGRRVHRRPAPDPGSARALECADAACGVERDLALLGRERPQRGSHGGPIGTPRATRISLSAAWNGIGPRSVRSAETRSPADASRSCTSAATISGNAVARPETAPSAPCASASSTSGSDPTNRSSPSST